MSSRTLAHRLRTSATWSIAMAVALVFVFSPDLLKKKTDADQVAGTITKADRLRAGQITAKDVILTKEDVMKILQDPQAQNMIKSIRFQKAMADPNFSNLLKNGDFANALMHPEFANMVNDGAMANLVKDGDFANALMRPEFANLVQDPNFANLMKDPDFANLTKGGNFAAIFMRPEFANLMKDPNFANLMKNGDFAKLLLRPEFANLLKGGDFANLLKDYSYQGVHQIINILNSKDPVGQTLVSRCFCIYAHKDFIVSTYESCPCLNLCRHFPLIYFIYKAIIELTGISLCSTFIEISEKFSRCPEVITIFGNSIVILFNNCHVLPP